MSLKSFREDFWHGRFYNKCKGFSGHFHLVRGLAVRQIL